MEYRTVFVHRPGTQVLVAPCDSRLAAIDAEAAKLAQAACCAGLHVTRRPFAQLFGAFFVFVNVPVAGVSEGDRFDQSQVPGGWAAVTEGVSFGEARAVVREVAMAMAAFWTANGPAEFHPGAPGSDRGSIVIPVRPVAEPQPQPEFDPENQLLVTAIPGV